MVNFNMIFRGTDYSFETTAFQSSIAGMTAEELKYSGANVFAIELNGPVGSENLKSTNAEIKKFFGEGTVNDLDGLSGDTLGKVQLGGLILKSSIDPNSDPVAVTGYFATVGTGVAAKYYFLPSADQDLAGIDLFDQDSGNLVAPKVLAAMNHSSAPVDAPYIDFIGQEGLLSVFDASVFRGSVEIPNPELDNEVTVSTPATSAYGEGGNDKLIGLAGSQLLEGGEGNDTLIGGDGRDYLVGGEGNDSIEGGDGRDYISAGNKDDVDTVDGGAGDDIIVVGKGDIVKGQTGDDEVFVHLETTAATAITQIDGGSDADGLDVDTANFTGLVGDTSTNKIGGMKINFQDQDKTTAATWTDTGFAFAEFTEVENVVTGDLADYVNASNTDDNVGARMGGGADVFIDTGAGNNSVSGGGGADTITSGTGNDTIDGGSGDDEITGGTGDDTFIYENGDGKDTITDFGDGTDFIDLSEFYNNKHLASVNAKLPEGSKFERAEDMMQADLADGVLDGMIDGVDYSAIIGNINLSLQNGGKTIDKTDLTTDNTGVPCFTAESMIKTIDGLKTAKDIVQGDLVWTKDNGFQPVRWVGHKSFGAADMDRAENLRPVIVRENALGQGVPNVDIRLSQQHRVLVNSSIVERVSGKVEALVAIKHLVRLAGIDIDRDCTDVTYIHFLFDQHQIVQADGMESESLFTGPEALKSVGEEARSEIMAIFAELADVNYDAFKHTARPFLTGRQGRKITARHLQGQKSLVS